MNHNANEYTQTLLDRVATGQLSRRGLVAHASAAGVMASASSAAGELSGATNAPSIMIGGRAAAMIMASRQESGGSR
jgi:hypothetical protein